MKLTSYLYLVPRLRKCGVITPLPNTFSWMLISLLKCSKVQVLGKGSDVRNAFTEELRAN
jgi:hypothetical protein